mmetsp:Transcript_104022/g.299593  ORF Transcript_104022/g.299593 Transcript_104022/m.299593 type:complete len:99 (+) Transcript_104022:160-456(+)
MVAPEAPVEKASVGTGIREKLEEERKLNQHRQAAISKLDPNREGAFYTLGVPDIADVTEMDERIQGTLAGTKKELEEADVYLQVSFSNTRAHQPRATH